MSLKTVISGIIYISISLDVLVNETFPTLCNYDDFYYSLLLTYLFSRNTQTCVELGRYNSVISRIITQLQLINISFGKEMSVDLFYPDICLYNLGES